MENSTKSSVNRQTFAKNLDVILSKKKDSNNRYFTKAKYRLLIKKIKSVRKKRKDKSENDKPRYKKFEIVKEKKKERLIVPNSDKRIYYITKDELYDVINEAHLSTDHGGKTLLFKKLKEDYKNVTHESIAVYLNLCTVCKERKSKPKPPKPPKPVKSAPKENVSKEPEEICKGMLHEVKPRGTFYFIDMQEEPDGDYKFILVYEDDITKFVQLKPLKTKEVKEVAKELCDIFSTFGAPLVLQSGSDEEMSEGIIARFDTIWKGTPIKHEKISLEEQPNNEINKILYCWLCRSATYKWSDGLRFIQYIRNITYNEAINKSPFEAMFGRKGKLDISSLNLPKEVIGDIRSEEDPAFPDSNDNMNLIEINNMLEVVMDVSE